MKQIRNTFFLLIAMFLSFPFITVHAGSDVYVEDTYGVLSQDETEELNQLATEISDRYQFGVYARILYDEDSYDDINSYIEKYYAENDLGYGSTSDGILFLITQSSRGGSYDIYIPAVSRQDAFSISSLEDIQSESENYLYDHDYYSAIETYLNETEDKLSYYSSEGTPWGKNDDYSYDNDETTWDDDYGYSEGGTGVSGPDSSSHAACGLSFVIPAIVAGITVAIRRSHHRTKRIATNAGNYISSSGQLHLNTRSDIYLYSTETRTRIHQENNNHGGMSSGGGFTSSSGGMHSGGGHF